MSIDENVEIREITPLDKAWVSEFISQRWGSKKVVARGVIYTVDQLPGFIILMGGRRVGLLTYQISGSELEIITIDSLMEGKGIGTALINAAQEKAAQNDCRRIFLITTNDNLPALRFYQKRGFQISAIHINAIEKSRELKPEMPLVGMFGIPIRDEIELELII